MRSSLLALAAAVSGVSAVSQGFNYGATKSDGSFNFQSDFEAKFANAKKLVGTNGGYTSARLYTMIQGGSSTNEPTSAIPAAIAQDTTLLLGLWASGGEGGLQAEITALRSAIAQYGTAFTSRVVGISVGSEDLYRISPTGIAAKSGYGAEPSTLVSYIGEVRAAIAGTSLSGASIGHVDTWTAWVNGSNSAVINAVDWIGFDAYPYFQNTEANSVQDGKALFDEALAATRAAAGGKEVWITESGWPVSGSTENLAVPSTANAEIYYKAVACPLFGNTNVWWFTQQDADVTTPNPSFGLVGTTLSSTPLYDLSCSVSASASSSAVASSAAPSSSGIAVGGESTTGSSAPTSIAESVVSSVSSAATGGVIASSGGALAPIQIAPTFATVSGGAIATPTAIASGVAAPSGSTGGSGSGSSGSGTGSGGSNNGTIVGGASPTTAPTGIPANGASGLTASFVGATIAFLAVLVAL